MKLICTATILATLLLVAADCVDSKVVNKRGVWDFFSGLAQSSSPRADDHEEQSAHDYGSQHKSEEYGGDQGSTGGLGHYATGEHQESWQPIANFGHFEHHGHPEFSHEAAQHTDGGGHHDFGDHHHGGFEGHHEDGGSHQDFGEHQHGGFETHGHISFEHHHGGFEGHHDDGHKDEKEHHDSHGDHHDVKIKYVTVTERVPVPYKVTVEKKVLVPVKVPFTVHTEKVVPVYVEKKFPVIVEKQVQVPVDKPYEVKVPYKVEVHKKEIVKVEKPVPVKIEKPVPYHVEKPYIVEKHVPIKVWVNVKKDYHHH